MDEKNPDLKIQKKNEEDYLTIVGPTKSMGYPVEEKNPDLKIQKQNEEDYLTIDGVRSFCTGDVCQVSARGCLHSFDRKKDLF